MSISLETVVPSHQSTRRHIPEINNLRCHHYEDIKFAIFFSHRFTLSMSAHITRGLPLFCV
jgi:hypothetical protein